MWHTVHFLMPDYILSVENCCYDYVHACALWAYMGKQSGADSSKQSMCEYATNV